MPQYRLGQAARVLGVSVDTIRRHVDAGRLGTERTRGGQRLVDGAELAALAQELDRERAGGSGSSARNHLLGIVTEVRRDAIAAQVEMRCGPFRLVSLVTREAVDSLGLEPGVLVNAVVKATNVVVELAAQPARSAGEEG